LAFAFELVVPVDEDDPDPVDPVDPVEAVEPLEEPELDIPVFEEPDVLALEDEELLELDPVVPVFELEDEPAFLVVFDFEVLVGAAVVVVSVVPEAPPCPLNPPAAEPPAWPEALLLTPRPEPVVAPVPPTSPINASTWQRTVAFVALSSVPFSTTIVSTSPESIVTNRNGDLVFPNRFAGRYPACQA
jgi:hypothetical protein